MQRHFEASFPSPRRHSARLTDRLSSTSRLDFPRAVDTLNREPTQCSYTPLTRYVAADDPPFQRTIPSHPSPSGDCSRRQPGRPIRAIEVGRGGHAAIQRDSTGLHGDCICSAVRSDVATPLLVRKVPARPRSSGAMGPGGTVPRLQLLNLIQGKVATLAGFMAEKRFREERSYRARGELEVILSGAFHKYGAVSARPLTRPSATLSRRERAAIIKKNSPLPLGEGGPRSGG